MKKISCTFSLLIISLFAAMSQSTTATDYPLSFDGKTTYVSRTDRGMLSVGFKEIKTHDITSSPALSDLLFHDLLEKTIPVIPGQTVKPVLGYKGTWMCGYLYIDWEKDGFFSVEINEDGTPATGSDVVSYSAYNQKNSAGESLSNNNTLEMPIFTVPQSIDKGFYRMRFKVDWDNINPAGSESLQQHGGGIADLRLNVHEAKVCIEKICNNGKILSSNGSQLPEDINFGESLVIRLNPDDGFTYNGVRIRHGYNLHGDSLVHGTPQYIDEIVFRTRFDSNNCYTIPSEWVDGDMLIEALFVEKGAEMEFNYPINFEKDALVERSDRHLDGVEMNGTIFNLNTGIYAGDRKLYHEDMKKTFFAEAGEFITASFSYTGTWMNGYIYVDREQDGVFSWNLDDDGQPTADSDLLAFSHLNGKNSEGETVQGNTLNPPPFAVPILPDGFYRLRYKVDWNNVDPGGNTSESNSITKNAGGIIDARLRIFSGTEVNIETKESQNGTLQTSEDSPLPFTTAYHMPLYIKAVPQKGYRIETIQILHGVLTGPEIIKSVPQRITSNFIYDDFTDGILTIPADIVDGDMQIQATFIPDDGYVPSTISTLRAEECEGGVIVYFDGTPLIEPVSIADNHIATILVNPDAGQKLESLCIQTSDTEINVLPSQMNLNRYDVPASLFADRARVVCSAVFVPIEEGETGWEKVWRYSWGDEFNTKDVRRPDETRWSTPARYSSAWNRFISDNDAVSFVSDGNYVARCIENPDKTTDDVEMISGAIQSRSKYSFQYGRVEARIKTLPHSGNFPAFWLMPQNQPDGWPNNGEIDIMEQINVQNTAHQNIHTNWSYNLGKKDDPPSSGSCSVNMKEWHDYALEWYADLLIWYVDGKRVFSYGKKVSDEDALSKGQWPFDREFYIILNQSVGNGSWASNPDKSFQYETLFDYVRVYQLYDRDDYTGITSATNNKTTEKPWYDLQGRRIAKPTTSGVYIHGRKKIYIK